MSHAEFAVFFAVITFYQVISLEAICEGKIPNPKRRWPHIWSLFSTFLSVKNLHLWFNNLGRLDLLIWSKTLLGSDLQPCRRRLWSRVWTRGSPAWTGSSATIATNSHPGYPLLRLSQVRLTPSKLHGYTGQIHALIPSMLYALPGETFLSHDTRHCSSLRSDTHFGNPSLPLSGLTTHTSLFSQVIIVISYLLFVYQISLRGF